MMSQWLRALPALPEDTALIPSTHTNPRHCEGVRVTARPWVSFPRFPLEASSAHSFLTDLSFLCVQFSDTNTSCLGTHCAACRSMCKAASPKPIAKGSWSCCHCSGWGGWPQVQWCGVVSVCALGSSKLSHSLLCSRSPGLFPVGE